MKDGCKEEIKTARTEAQIWEINKGKTVIRKAGKNLSLEDWTFFRKLEEVLFAASRRKQRRQERAEKRKFDGD